MTIFFFGGSWVRGIQPLPMMTVFVKSDQSTPQRFANSCTIECPCYEVFLMSTRETMPEYSYSRPEIMLRNYDEFSYSYCFLRGTLLL